jgi:hypothetical protein
VKHVKHPATIIAAIALFAALSGGAGAAMTTLISGSQIKNGSIPMNKLEPSAIKGLSALQGVSGAESTSIGLQGIVVARHRNGVILSKCPTNATVTPTWCSPPTVVTFGKKTAVLVTGALDLASNNGLSVSANLGICYAPHGSLSLVSVQFVEPDFVAPTDSFFAQADTGIVKGLKAGRYDVGFCVANESSNANNGYFNVSTVTFQTR